MQSRLKRSPLHAGLWSAVAVAVLAGAYGCGGGNSADDKADAGGGGDNVPDIPIPDLECWGPVWKCGDGGGPDGGVDPRAPTDFHADLTGALVPQTGSRDYDGSATVTLDGAQTKLTIAVQHNASPARVLVRRGSLDDVNAETVAEIDASSNVNIPVTQEIVKALLRGEVFLEVEKNGTPLLRGPILRADEVLYVAHLNGDEASTPHGSSESVTVYLVHDRSSDAYRYWTPASQLTTRPTSMELDVVGGSKFEDLDPTKDGVGVDELEGFGTASFNTSEKPAKPLGLGNLIVKARLPGTPGEELVGTLMPPGSQLYVSQMDGFQLTPTVSTPNSGSARFVVNYRVTKMVYSLSTTSMPSEISLRSLGRDTTTVPPLFVFPSEASSEGTISIGSGSGQISSSALDAIRAGRSFVFVRSREKDEHGADKYPNGELAGVVLGSGEKIYLASLSPSLNPASQAATGSGSAWLFVNAAQTSGRYVLTTSGVPTVTAWFEVAAARAPSAPLAPRINITASAEAFGTIEFPAESPFAAALEIGALRIRIGTDTQQPERSEIAGHMIRPGETLYVAGLFSAGIAPMPSSSQAAGYGMAVVDAMRSKARVSASMLTAVSGMTVCSGVAGTVGTNCTTLAEGPEGVPYSATITYDDAGFRRGKWYVQANSDPGAFPRGELRGPLVLPGEAVMFAYLNAGGVVSMTPSSSTATGQIAFISNADRTEIRYDGTLLNVTPTGTGWGSLRLFQAKTGQTVPLFPAPTVLQDVTSTSVTGTITGKTLAFHLGLIRGDYSVDVLTTDTTNYPDGLIRGAVLSP